jgi:hypothetical protein
MTEDGTIQMLEREGWTRRFVACEPRLSEAAEIYEQVGFEVHLEPLPWKSAMNVGPGRVERGECRTCFEGFEDQYRIVFTRPKRKALDAEAVSPSVKQRGNSS